MFNPSTQHQPRPPSNHLLRSIQTEKLKGGIVSTGKRTRSPSPPPMQPQIRRDNQQAFRPPAKRNKMDLEIQPPKPTTPRFGSRLPTRGPTSTRRQPAISAERLLARITRARQEIALSAPAATSTETRSRLLMPVAGGFSPGVLEHAHSGQAWAEEFKGSGVFGPSGTLRATDVPALLHQPTTSGSMHPSYPPFAHTFPLASRADHTGDDTQRDGYGTHMESDLVEHPQDTGTLFSSPSSQDLSNVQTAMHALPPQDSTMPEDFLETSQPSLSGPSFLDPANLLRFSSGSGSEQGFGCAEGAHTHRIQESPPQPDGGHDCLPIDSLRSGEQDPTSSSDTSVVGFVSSKTAPIRLPGLQEWYTQTKMWQDSYSVLKNSLALKPQAHTTMEAKSSFFSHINAPSLLNQSEHHDAYEVHPSHLPRPITPDQGDQDPSSSREGLKAPEMPPGQSYSATNAAPASELLPSGPLGPSPPSFTTPVLVQAQTPPSMISANPSDPAFRPTVERQPTEDNSAQGTAALETPPMTNVDVEPASKLLPELLPSGPFGPSLPNFATPVQVQAQSHSSTAGAKSFDPASQPTAEHQPMEDSRAQGSAAPETPPGPSYGTTNNAPALEPLLSGPAPSIPPGPSPPGVPTGAVRFLSFLFLQPCPDFLKASLLDSNLLLPMLLGHLCMSYAHQISNSTPPRQAYEGFPLSARVLSDWAQSGRRHPYGRSHDRNNIDSASRDRHTLLGGHPTAIPLTHNKASFSSGYPSENPTAASIFTRDSNAMDLTSESGRQDRSTTALYPPLTQPAPFNPQPLSFNSQSPSARVPEQTFSQQHPSSIQNNGVALPAPIAAFQPATNNLGPPLIPSFPSQASAATSLTAKPVSSASFSIAQVPHSASAVDVLVPDETTLSKPSHAVGSMSPDTPVPPMHHVGSHNWPPLQAQTGQRAGRHLYIHAPAHNLIFFI
ncbi:hypothetical protein NLJ89_g11199 [Agrocybe chaxingu]|uniref:Uncharacterized protein n=1 Tax=Agrocybe chaxingu TaxID=84603 RepID=A0A9W8MRV1_9AGAR|nr:hypothetical protein NLJ89_g11199 [Agrocybe chaxingu]